MDIYRNNMPVVFPEEKNNKSGKGDSSAFARNIVIMVIMFASVIICFASLVSANRMVKQYSAACTALQAQLDETSRRNAALVDMLEAKFGA